MNPADEASERLFQMVLGALETFNVALGDRLGLYQILDGDGATAAGLAERAGTDPRWTREWLEQQAVGGLVTVSGADEPVFALAPGYAETLTQPDGLYYLAPLARMTAATGLRMDDIEAAARHGGGVPWSAYGKEMRDGQAAINKPALINLLASEWLPGALPELTERLSAGERISAMDVGCGAGWAAIGAASAFPSLEVDAIDIDPETIRLATDNVAEAGLAERVHVLATDLREEAEPAYDFAMAIECIHDMPDPVGVLEGVRRRLKPGAPALVVDERVAEEFAPNGDELERIMYCYSTLICLPDGMSTSPSAATGTVMRPSTLERYAREAGFASVTVAPVENDFFRFYVLHQE